MLEHKYIIEAKELLYQLTNQCVPEMSNRHFSNLSMLPYKVMSFVNAMHWRMKQCAEAALLLLGNDLTHPSLMLIRSSMENAAITIKLADVVRAVVERSTIVNSDDSDLMKLLFGNNYREDDPYIEPEDSKLRADRIGKHVRRAEELYPGFQRYYSYLCEFVHPNSDGVGQSFSLLDIENDKTSFGPNLNRNHGLYDTFTITLVLSLTVYLDQINIIDTNLEDFIHICDVDVVKKTLSKL